MNDPATSPSVALRRETLRERAADDPAAPPELLAAAAFISVLTNEPAEVGAELASRALLAGQSTPPGSDGQAVVLVRNVVLAATLSLLWAERYAQVRPLLDASIAQARATGDSGRLAIGLANRGWLALRRGDLSAAEGDTRTALAATELPAPPLYRVLNAGVLVKALVDQGELDAAEEVLAPLDSEAESGSLTAAVLRFARGRLRVAQGRVAEGLEDFLAVGVAPDASAGHLPELPPLAIGGRARPPRARRSRVGGTPRRRGARARPGIRRPARARRGEACRRRRGRRRPWRAPAPRGDRRVRARLTPGWSERALSPTSAPCFGGAIGAPKRGSSSARHSTPPTAPAPDRSPNRPRPSSAPPARARAGSFSRARLADRQRAPHRRARQPGPHQPRDRPDALRHRAHGRGSPHEHLPQAAARLAKRASRRACWRHVGSGLVRVRRCGFRAASLMVLAPLHLASTRLLDSHTLSFVSANATRQRSSVVPRWRACARRALARRRSTPLARLCP